MSGIGIIGLPTGTAQIGLRTTTGRQLLATTAVSVFNPDLGGFRPTPDFTGLGITATRTSIVAGQGVTFSAGTLNSDAVLFADYEWTFSTEFPGDDEENYLFGHLTGSRIAGERANTAKGPYVGHVYLTPGVHTVTCRVYWGGALVDTLTETIAVTDHTDLPTWYWSSAYADATAFKAAAEADVPALAGIDVSRFLVGTLTDAINTVSDATEHRRLSIFAGHDYTMAEYQQNAGREPNNLYIDTFGTGARPKLIMPSVPETRDFTSGSIFHLDTVENVTIRGLDLRGQYDAANPGYYEPWLGAHRGITMLNRAHDLTVFDCSFSGFSQCFIPASTSQDEGVPPTWVMSNCLMTNWYDYGIFSEMILNSSLVGCAIIQVDDVVLWPRKVTRIGLADTGDRYTFNVQNSENEPTPLEGPGALTSTGWKNCANHGPFRNGQHPELFAMHQCWFRSRNGWSNQGSFWPEGSPREGEVKFAIQPCVRIMQSIGGLFSRGKVGLQRMSAWRCQMEGGGLIGLTGQNAGEPIADTYTLPLGFVFSEIIGIADNTTPTVFEAWWGNICLRNSVIHVVNQATDGYFTAFTAFTGAYNPGIVGVDPARVDPSDMKTPSYVMATTVLVDHARSGNLTLFTREANGRPVIVRDVAWLVPTAASWGNVTPTSASTSNLTATGGLLDTLTDYMPQAGSVLAGAAQGPAPYRDALGAVRPDPASVGAFEVE